MKQLGENLFDKSNSKPKNVTNFTHFSLPADPGCGLEAGAECDPGGHGKAVQQRGPALAQRWHVPPPSLLIKSQH